VHGRQEPPAGAAQLSLSCQRRGPPGGACSAAESDVCGPSRGGPWSRDVVTRRHHLTVVSALRPGRSVDRGARSPDP
jgi:hypothetical protein